MIPIILYLHYFTNELKSLYLFDDFWFEYPFLQEKYNFLITIIVANEFKLIKLVHNGKYRLYILAKAIELKYQSSCIGVYYM